ncbi:MAG: uroporphyrinogen decarboxylase family protein [Bacillota bacterium]|nr:uroporphyrinogen decarboxylase family protein [Bacillota bacterium]
MLTSKERILRCLRHEPIDRVPISTYELVGWNPDAWQNKAPAYRHLMEIIRQQTDCIYMANPTLIEAPNPYIQLKSENDHNCIYTTLTYLHEEGSFTAQYRQDDGIHTRWKIRHLLSEVSDIRKYLSIPHYTPEVDMSSFNKERDNLADHGVMMISLSDPVSLAASLFGMETFLVYAITETAEIIYLMDALFERQMAILNKMLNHDINDVLFRICGPEYATPPYLHKRYFPEFVTKYLIIMCRAIRQAGGIPRIHCHGKIAEVIDQFALTDAVALDPLEPPPDGDLPLASIKKRFGKRFCLFGNIELRELELAKPEQIDALVKNAMDDAKGDSGFVLMPTAAPINDDLSPVTERNYIQMIESAHRYGKYA